MKNSDKDKLETSSIWTVWYEDRFGYGPDRYPASLVALLLTKTEAEHYINTHEGPIDIQSGKFDGLFTKEWKAADLINSNLAKIEDIQNLLNMKPPAQLRRHWEKGWI